MPNSMAVGRRGSDAPPLFFVVGGGGGEGGS